MDDNMILESIVHLPVKETESSLSTYDRNYSAYPFQYKLPFSQEPGWKAHPLQFARPKSTPEDGQTSSDANAQAKSSNFGWLNYQALGSIETSPCGRTGLQDLPEEIQQTILDFLLGSLRSTSSSAVEERPGMRNWNNVMRHPRSREISSLTLVSSRWRRLIQERLYRHIKIKATQTGLEESAVFILTHRHLQSYVRHVEFWVPVWERRVGPNEDELAITSPSGGITLEQQARPYSLITYQSLRRTYQQAENINNAYKLSSHNASMDEIFECVRGVFPEACILTMEGGLCVNAPVLQQYRNPKRLLVDLPSIRTLIFKGAGTIIQHGGQFRQISAAIPSLREWHCSYARPKIEAHSVICNILDHFPPTLTHLNLCLEGFYNKQMVLPGDIRHLQLSHHICRSLGRVIPQLEALTLTGRMCSALFTSAIEAVVNVWKPKLRSLDLIVKTCCRASGLSDGTGIHDWTFIREFEALVTAAVRALGVYPNLDFLRIRFIDLDAPYPLLHPYFQLSNGECSGIWSDTILDLLRQFRPLAKFEVASQDLDERGIDKVLLTYPTHRPKGIKVSNYMAFADRV